MTTTENPAVGEDVDANGIRTNYLEAGSGDQTVVFVHGSGPGVTAYANWRGVLPVLGENFRCVAPDMVGFGYSERPEKPNYGLDTWADQTLGVPHRTLIVHGREDQVIPLETSLKLLQLLDNADLSVFSHCGHWSMIERRDDFNRQVRDFFLGN